MGNRTSINLRGPNINNDDHDQAAIKLAKKWAGQLVKIEGLGGIIVTDCPTSSSQPSATVRTDYGLHHNDIDKIDRVMIRLYIEAVPDVPHAVAFRVSGTDLYLTNVMYGDKPRQEISNVLASIPDLLPDNIGMIVDYAVGRPTDESNFEGAGFHYSPMTAQRGPPNKLQMFVLESTTGDAKSCKLGVKSLFGTYWRSPDWDNNVTQSPNLLADETFYFKKIKLDMGWRQ